MAIGIYGPEYLQFSGGGPARDVQIYVFLPGTKTKAQLYADSSGLYTGPNPTSTDVRGELVFYAEAGDYDIYTPVTDTTIPVTVVSGGGGITLLNNLGDVDTSGSATGDALVRAGDGNWRPAPLMHHHFQDALSTVLIITHGLPFDPSGIVAVDTNGTKHYPKVSYPTAKTTIRLDFRRDFRGDVWLS